MTTLRWITGTAYDFFISLHALHHAQEYGLRANWTAGVRQRLSPPHRELLERISTFAAVPLDWVSTLPEPKDALPALHLAAALSPADCLRALTLPAETAHEAVVILDGVAGRGLATATQKESLARLLTYRKQHIKAAQLDAVLSLWVRAESSAAQLLDALQEYYTAFFADEETRIRPALQAGLEAARQQAKDIPLAVLVEKLSRGVRFEELAAAKELVLVPSYWSTPYVFPSTPAPHRMQIVFGCRSDLQGVAPSAGTPDALINALKSLADPTLLRILRYLHARPHTPTELSRLLRLRPPTVIHHLQALRLAELVTIRVSEQGEKRYAARLETLNNLFALVKDFLSQQD